MPTKKQKSTKKVVVESSVTLSFFSAIGILLWQSSDELFFLINFGYIGLAAAIGELLFGLLPREKKVIGRKFSQLMIGVYMLGVLGFLGRENMQIEGFFFYLLAGTFSGPVLHYLIAKIGGTFLFGRGWCSWACWTTMVMDFFPWMKPRQGRLKHLGTLRYVHFAIALALVLLLWFMYEMKDFDKHSVIELNWLIIGNLFYFAVAIILTVVLKDNRAFCKYVCPIPVLMKFGSRFSIWKIKIEPEKCTECRLCETNCPMNVQLLSYMKNNQRVHSSECIACQQCVNVCPEEAVNYTKGFDSGFKDFLHYRND